MFRTFVCFTYLFKNENGVISERRYRRLIIAKLCFHDNGVAIGYELYFEIRWISVFFFFRPPFSLPSQVSFQLLERSRKCVSNHRDIISILIVRQLRSRVLLIR